MSHASVRPSARLAVALAAGLVTAAPLAAQRRPAPAPAARAEPTVELTPYAGMIVFGDIVDGPLGTRLRNRPAPIGGAQLAVRLGPSLALVGNVGYSSGDLEVGAPILGGVRVGSSSSWVYDAGLELRLPTTATGSVVPFLQAGGGAITTRLSSGPVRTTATNAAFNAGAGLDVSLGGALGVRLLVRDYVSRFQSEEIAGLRARGELTHNLAASAGIRLAF